MADFSRVFIEHATSKKVHVVYDFAYGEYLATINFFDKISKIQSDLLSTGKVILDTGQEADASSPGGLIAVQLYMETVESTRQSMSGLSKLGLNVEKQLWKNI
jgi:hypothetical protein